MKTALAVVLEGTAKAKTQTAFGSADYVFSLLKPVEPITIDGVIDTTKAAGRPLTRQQVRNALHYLVRTNRIESVSRGVWLLNAGTPAATGVPDGVPTNTEGVDSRETDETASVAAEDQHHPQLGASIAG